LEPTGGTAGSRWQRWTARRFQVQGWIGPEYSRIKKRGAASRGYQLRLMGSERWDSEDQCKRSGL